MASASPLRFDLIDSVGYGYHRVWQERTYLLRLALVPFVIKFFMTLTVYAMGLEDDILRSGLIKLPGFLVQGWVLAQFLRTVMLEERWPMPIPAPGDELAIGKLILRARGIISSTLVYVLIALFVSVMGWGASLLDTSMQEAVQQQAATGTPAGQDSNPIFFIPALMLMAGMILAFPLLWIYIPYVVLMPVREYFRRVFGFLNSLKLFGIYLICMVPLSVLASLIIYAFVKPFGVSLEDTPIMIRFILIFISAAVDLITSLIVTTGIVYALRDILPRHPAALADVR